MRESSKIEKTHLPPDAFEEWVKSQPVKPGAGRPSRKPAQNSYEVWVGKRVEKRAEKRIKKS
jgi:hypothetical protein